MMNIVAGKISDAAREAIEAAGGTIEATLNSQTSTVLLPPGAVRVTFSGSKDFLISLPGSATLIFTQEQSELDLNE